MLAGEIELEVRKASAAELQQARSQAQTASSVAQAANCARCSGGNCNLDDFVGRSTVCTLDDGLPKDIRATLEGAMKDATKYANDLAQKDNDDAIEAVKKSGKTEILTLTAELAPFYSSGGLGDAVLHHVHGLAALGHEVTVVVGYRSGADEAEALAAEIAQPPVWHTRDDHP